MRRQRLIMRQHLMTVPATQFWLCDPILFPIRSAHSVDIVVHRRSVIAYRLG